MLVAATACAVALVLTTAVAVVLALATAVVLALATAVTLVLTEVERLVTVVIEIWTMPSWNWLLEHTTIDSNINAKTAHYDDCANKA